MSDAVALRSKLQTIDRGLRQRRRVLFEPPHAHRCVGEIAARIEGFDVDASLFGKLLGARHE
jgi:hypothetical protein